MSENRNAQTQPTGGSHQQINNNEVLHNQNSTVHLGNHDHDQISQQMSAANLNQQQNLNSNFQVPQNQVPGNTSGDSMQHQPGFIDPNSIQFHNSRYQEVNAQSNQSQQQQRMITQRLLDKQLNVADASNNIREFSANLQNQSNQPGQFSNRLSSMNQTFNQPIRYQYQAPMTISANLHQNQFSQFKIGENSVQGIKQQPFLSQPPYYQIQPFGQTTGPTTYGGYQSTFTYQQQTQPLYQRNNSQHVSQGPPNQIIRYRLDQQTLQNSAVGNKFPSSADTRQDILAPITGQTGSKKSLSQLSLQQNAVTTKSIAQSGMTNIQHLQLNATNSFPASQNRTCGFKNKQSNQLDLTLIGHSITLTKFQGQQSKISHSLSSKNSRGQSRKSSEQLSIQEQRAQPNAHRDISGTPNSDIKDFQAQSLSQQDCQVKQEEDGGTGNQIHNRQSNPTSSLLNAQSSQAIDQNQLQNQINIDIIGQEPPKSDKLEIFKITRYERVNQQQTEQRQIFSKKRNASKHQSKEPSSHQSQPPSSHQFQPPSSNQSQESSSKQIQPHSTQQTQLISSQVPLTTLEFPSYLLQKKLIICNNPNSSQVVMLNPSLFSEQQLKEFNNFLSNFTDYETIQFMNTSENNQK
eukprot:403364104